MPPTLTLAPVPRLPPASGIPTGLDHRTAGCHSICHGSYAGLASTRARGGLSWISGALRYPWGFREWREGRRDLGPTGGGGCAPRVPGGAQSNEGFREGQTPSRGDGGRTPRGGVGPLLEDQSLHAQQVNDRVPREYYYY